MDAWVLSYICCICRIVKVESYDDVVRQYNWLTRSSCMSLRTKKIQFSDPPLISAISATEGFHKMLNADVAFVVQWSCQVPTFCSRHHLIVQNRDSPRSQYIFCCHHQVVVNPIHLSNRFLGEPLDLALSLKHFHCPASTCQARQKNPWSSFLPFPEFSRCTFFY